MRMRLASALAAPPTRRPPAAAIYRGAGLLAGLLALCLSAEPAAAQAAGAPAAKQAGKDKPPPPPEAPARLWLIAPGPTGPWTLRIDNEGERPMRIAADARLLQLEVETTEVPAKGKPKKKTVKCSAPASMRPTAFPEPRALLLAPGYSYIEELDPHLVCFGKDAAALAGGAVVRAWLGWSPPSKWARKAPEGPFMVESTDDPSAFAPARGLAAPPIVLSYGAPEEQQAEAKPAGAAADKPAADKPTADKPTADKPAADKADKQAADKAPAAGNQAPSGVATNGSVGGGAPSTAPAVPAAVPAAKIVDANAPRLEVTSDAWADAGSPRSVSVGVVAKNAGKRPMTVALRPRMLEFVVEGPDGEVVCAASPPTGGVPRDLFRTLKPGGTGDFKVLLKEVCPSGAFTREGLYRITATLHANEAGAGLGIEAYTADVPAKNATKLRLQDAPEPFYSSPPRAVPTPGREPPAAGAGGAGQGAAPASPGAAPAPAPPSG